MEGARDRSVEIKRQRFRWNWSSPRYVHLLYLLERFRSLATSVMRRDAVCTILLNIVLFCGMACTLAPQDPRYLRFSAIENGLTTHYNLRVSCLSHIPLYSTLILPQACKQRSSSRLVPKNHIQHSSGLNLHCITTTLSV